MTERAFLFGLVTAAAAALTLALAPTQSLAATPLPKILVVDRNMVLQLSKVGQDVVRQVQAYSDQAKRDLDSQGNSLRAQGEALKQQLAILSADVKQKKIAEFEAKERNLQAQVQKKRGLIQGGLFKARQQMDQALGPILQGIVLERGANLLLDRNAVLLGTDPNLDITRVAVQRLDQKMPTIKVELVPLPPEILAQQQQQAAQQ
jgi:Skp family chaperone for outer membrane proteins